jgi:hypothetical protein
VCYNCRRSGHLAKRFPEVCPIFLCFKVVGHNFEDCPRIIAKVEGREVGPICLCCKVVGHEVEDCPRIIAKVEGRNIRQENYEKIQETKGC